MLPTLRNYQSLALTELYDALARGVRGVCFQGPTGSGKGVILSHLLSDGTPQILYTDRRILFDQLRSVLSESGVKFGMRASGYATDFDAPVQLAMIQTEYNKVFKRQAWPMHECQRVLVDEIHNVAAATAIKIVQAHAENGANLVGFTATPREISHLCDEQVSCGSVASLTRDGFLVPAVVFTPDAPSLEKLEFTKRQANGEYSPTELCKVWDCQKIIGRVIEHYQAINPEKRPTILFAAGVQESLWFAQRFTEAGFPFAHIDGRSVWVDGESQDSNPEIRQEIFARLQNGDLCGITNRFVLREGLDLPFVSHIILATPFGGRANFVQACGRGLRPSEGKEYCSYQDHCGSFWRFPALDSNDPWDMHTPAVIQERLRVKAMRGESVERPEMEGFRPIVCPECTLMRVSGRVCPNCGFSYEKRTRPVIQLDGSLTLQSGPLYKARKVKSAPDDAKVWKGLFWASRKNKPHRTLEQVYCFYAKNNRWRWLPRDLPFMPNSDLGWTIPVRELDIDRDLIAEAASE